MSLLIMSSFLSIGDENLDILFSFKVKEARVRFRVSICGASDRDPGLSECLDERLASDEEGMAKCLRQDDPPLPL